MPVEDEVLGHAERADETVVGAVLGHVAAAVVQDVLDRRTHELEAGQPGGPGDVGLEPEQGLDQLGLAVALDPGDHEDLAVVREPDLDPFDRQLSSVGRALVGGPAGAVQDERGLPERRCAHDRSELARGL